MSFLKPGVIKQHKISISIPILFQQEDWQKDELSRASISILGGRTPLMIACARDDNYKNACRVVDLLLQHHANPNLLCNGYSPLALAITSGNDHVSLW